MVQAPWLPGASSQPIAPARSSACWLVSSACSLLSSRPPSSNCTARRAAQNPGWLHYCARMKTFSVSPAGWMCFSCVFLSKCVADGTTYNTMVLSKHISVSVRSTITMSVSKISPPSCSRQNTAHRWSSTKDEVESQNEKHMKTTAFIQLHHEESRFQLKNSLTCNPWRWYVTDWTKRWENTSDLSSFSLRDQLLYLPRKHFDCC